MLPLGTVAMTGNIIITDLPRLVGYGAYWLFAKQKNAAAIGAAAFLLSRLRGLATRDSCDWSKVKFPRSLLSKA